MATGNVDSDVVDTLNSLIETAKDGQYGFVKCAERVKTQSIRDVLTRRAADCERAAGELQNLVSQHGGKPETGGSALGAMHRGWVSMKAAVGADSDHSILDEAERGEDAALAAYRKAMKNDALPATVRDVLARQMAGAQANHDQIKALRDSTKS